MKRSLSLIMCSCFAVASVAPLESGATEPQLADPKKSEGSTLRDAVAAALEHNFDIRSSHSEAQAAEGPVWEEEGAFDFNVKLEASQRNDRTPSASSLDGVGVAATVENDTTTLSTTFQKKFATGTELTIPYAHRVIVSNSSYVTYRTRHEPTASVSLNQPLIKLSPSYQTKDLQMARKDWEIGRAKSYQDISKSVLQVIEQYTASLAAQRSVEVQRLMFEASKQMAEFVEVKQKIGKASSVDVLDTRSEVLRNEVQMKLAESDAASKLEELSVALWAEKRPLALKDVLDPGEIKAPAMPSDKDLENSVEEVLARRHDYKKSQLSLEKAQLARSAASLDLFPDLNLSGSLTGKGLDSGFTEANKQVFTGQYLGWSAGLSATMPLFRTAAKGADRMKTLQLEEEEMKLLQMRRSIELELHHAYRQVQIETLRLQATRQVVEAQKEKSEAQHVRYRLGKLALMDLILADRDYANAETEYAKAVVSYVKAKYDLAAARGTLFEDLGFDVSKVPVLQ